MVATLSASTVFGSKLQTVRLKTNNTPRVNRVACAMSDSRPLRTALAATLVVPAVLLTAQVCVYASLAAGGQIGRVVSMDVFLF